MMYEAMRRTISELDIPPTSRTGSTGLEEMAAFSEQMQVYQSYWSDDPEFDSSATEAAVPDLPCPEVDVEMMLRLLQFAIRANFGWPRKAPALAAFEVDRELGGWLQADRPAAESSDRLRYVSLGVNGGGGGQWHLVVDGGRLVGAGRGLRKGGGPTCYLSSATFAGLARGELSLEDSINAGRLVVTGNSVRPAELAKWFRDLAAPVTKQA